MEMTWCAIVVAIKAKGRNPSLSGENRGSRRGGEGLIASN
jgi:hypothetical protein